MGFRSATHDRNPEESNASRAVSSRARRSSPTDRTGGQTAVLRDIDHAEKHYGMEIQDRRTLQRLRMREETFGRQVHGWVDEGMPAEIMGKTRDMEAFRERQANRPAAVPTDIERQNHRSVQRSENAAAETTAAGETGVPEPVRNVISSSGRSLDGTIQRAMENRMGDSLGDVRIHTGSTAAAACEAINARAFTVGNHVAFNQGEYDPDSPEGQHVLAHELAHVRQQTGGAVSMLPQADLELEIDPDPALEREAEKTAKQVMAGGELGIQRLADSEVYVQRAGLGSLSGADSWSPTPSEQSTHANREPIESNVDEIDADPETLAAEVEQIKANQQLVMETLTEAQPGSPSDLSADALAQTAFKGAAGSLASAGAGAVIGTLAGGPAGTVVGAGVGAIGGMASDLVKQGVDYGADRLPGSQAQDLERMYSEMTRMYKELKEGSKHDGEDLPGIR